ncbi:ATP-binding protein [Micromonospora sp. DT81.3]|uniref:sensor histidine kinase n=1 Tax=Micromonospora sp. DT81.3 TaxID=3416523 RepID=UPI003CF2DD8C
MRFGTQVLVLQLACVTAVVAVCTAVFVWLGVQQLRSEAESSALSIARTVAVDGDVRAEVARISAEPGTPAAVELRGGALESLAADVQERTGALFVVITDDQGIRLAHPDPDRLGEVVSTSFEDALAGRETVGWDSGTLGESARAKVPVREPGGTEPVGEVSVGFARASVFGELPVLIVGIVIAALAAVAVGVLASLVLRRRLERLTLGVQPEELAGMVQNQAAVLDGVGDGVLASDPEGTVTVANSTAVALLGAGDLVGRKVRDLDLPAAVRDAILSPASGAEPLPLGERVVFIDTHPVSRGQRDLGLIAIIRDRTDIVGLTERLETVAAMTNALRVQRHEFANRLHVTAGLIDAGRVADARTYLDGIREVADDGAPTLHDLGEPFLESFLEAKAVHAAERGVWLRVGDDSLVLGVVDLPEDVATVLGNLIDNAVAAAVRGREPRWVEVELLDEADTLVATVTDSGPGMPDGGIPSPTRRQPADPDAVHGHGIGLPLAHEIATRLGGVVWLADAGGHDGHGAVFCARMPGVMRAASAARLEEGHPS